MENLQRPVPSRSPVEQMRAWIEWFGFGRIIGSAIAVVIVCAGGYWLLRSLPPSTEAALPRAGAPPTSVVDPAPAALPSVDPRAPDTAPDTATVVADAPALVIVHVAGAVSVPGVYGLPDGVRVDAAIAAAGGALVDADPNALNLAAPLTDGSRVYVPRVGEDVPTALVPVGGSAAAPVVPAAPTVVDVNRATAEQLDVLPGVGPATAAAIVTERERNGPFLGVDDLDRVPGIGPAKLEALRGLVTT